MQPNAPGTQGYNLYAYVANNPTTWVDPSGHTAAFSDLSPNQQKVLAALIVSAPLLFLALPAAIAGVFLYIACVLEGECRTYLNEAWALIEELGSDGSNDKKWDLDALVDAYHQWPMRPVLERPFRQMYSMATGMVPGLGDLYDLHVGMTGYDPVTGEHLNFWERILTGMAVIPVVSGHMLRNLDDALLLIGDGSHWIPTGPTGGSSSNIVFRALRSDEVRELHLGLFARSTTFDDLPPVSHVAGAALSPWISAGKNYGKVRELYYSGNGIAVIDLTKVENVSTIVDLSNGIPGYERSMLSNWAKAVEEVLIKDFVPSEAIIGIIP